MLTSIDKRLKKIAVEKYGDVFTDEEIEFSRVVAFNYISDVVKSHFPKRFNFTKENDFEWAFLNCLYYIKEENEEKMAEA